PVADGTKIYLATLRTPSGVKSNASGAASIAIAPGGTAAHVALRLSGLSSAATNIQIYYGGSESPANTPVRSLPRASFDDITWNIAAVGALTPADIVNALGTGRLFVLVQTADNPAGEIRGQFGPALGSAAFQTPPAPPALP